MKKRITAALLAICMVVTTVQFSATTSVDDSVITQESTDTSSNVAIDSEDDVIYEDTDESETTQENSDNSQEASTEEATSSESEESSNQESTVEEQDESYGIELDSETAQKVEEQLEEMEEHERILEHGGELEANALTAPEQEEYAPLRRSLSTYAAGNSISVQFFDSSVNNGTTPLESINWEAVDGTDSAKQRVIKTQINISGTNGYVDSKRGDITVEIPNMMYGVKSDEAARKNWDNAYMDVSIDFATNNTWYVDNANADAMDNKKFVFHNANLIKSNASINSTITVIYTITPKTMSDRLDEVTQRWIKVGEATRNFSNSIQATLTINGPLVQSEKQTVTSPNWPNNYPQFAECIPWQGALKVRYLMWKGKFGTDTKKPKYLAFFLDTNSELAREDSLFFNDYNGGSEYDIYGNSTHFERPLKCNPPYNIGGGKNFVVEESDYWIGMYGWQGGARGFKVDIYPVYVETYTSNTISMNYKMQYKLVLDEGNINDLKPIDSASTKDLIKINLFDYFLMDNTLDANRKYVENSKYPRFINFGVSPVLYHTNTSFLSTLGKFISTDTKAERATANYSIRLENELGEDGYPSISGGLSLGYLFGGEDVEYVERVNKDVVDGLFLYDSNTDTYSYDSKENAAQWNPEKDKIDLYDEEITANAINYYGGFYPFNNINRATKAITISRSYFAAEAAAALYKSKQPGCTDDEKKQYEDFANQLTQFINKIDKDFDEGSNWFYNSVDNDGSLYMINFSELKNYFYGMSQQLAFYQPVNGIVETDSGNHSMYYEFNGTNEFYLYIDNKLAASISGTSTDKKVRIDFETGTITYFDEDETVTETKKFTDIFNKDLLNSKGTFEDYSVHTMKIFTYNKNANKEYLGMNFNLQLIQNEIGEDGLIVNGMVTWDREPADIDSLEVNICRQVEGGNKEVYQTIEARKENGWKYALLCPGKDDDGNEYTYWVEEKTQFGDTYVVMYFDNENNFVKEPEVNYYNIYNALNIQMNDIKGIISWSQKPEGIGSIQLDVYRVAFDGTEEKFASVSTSAKKNWNWSLVAPEEDFDGNKYSYYVVEPLGELYEVWYYNDDVENRTKEPTVGYLNIYNKLLELQGEVTWNEIPDGIEKVKIDIIQTDADGNSKVFKTIDAQKRNDWKWTSYAPVVDNKNREYTYSVKQDSDMCEISYYKEDINDMKKDPTAWNLNVYNKSLNLSGEITWNKVPDTINSLKGYINTSETITSPNWPENYNPNMTEEEYFWEFENPGVDYFEIVFSDDCALESASFDWIRFYDKFGNNITSSVCGISSDKIGGTSMAGKTYIVSSDYVKITMRTDGINERKGFSATVTSYNESGPYVDVEIIQTNSNGNSKVYDTIKALKSNDWKWNYFVPAVDNNGHGEKYSYSVKHDSDMCYVQYYGEDKNSMSNESRANYLNVYNESLELNGEISWNEVPDGVTSGKIEIIQTDSTGNSTVLKTITVESSDDWKWNMFVPNVDSNGHGNQYSYSVRHDNTLCEVFYYDEDVNNRSKEEKANYINVYNRSLRIDGMVTWNEVPDNVDKVTLLLQGEAPNYLTYGQQFDVTRDEDWKYSKFVKAATENGHGNAIEYYIAEPDSSMYGITYYIDNIENGKHEPTIGYYNVHNLSKKIEGEITWDIEPYGVESIDISIYQVVDNFDVPEEDIISERYQIVSVRKADNWKYSLYVPYDDEAFVPYYYYMRENDTLTHKVVYYGEGEPIIDVLPNETTGGNDTIEEPSEGEEGGEISGEGEEVSGSGEDTGSEEDISGGSVTDDDQMPDVPGYGQRKPGLGLYNAYNYKAGYWTEQTNIRIQKKWLYRPPIGSIEMEIRRTNRDGNIDEFVRDIVIDSNGTRDWETIESVTRYEKYNTEWRYYVVEKTDGEGNWGTYYKNEFNGMTSTEPKAGHLIVYNYKIAKIKGNTSRLKINKILLNNDGEILSDEDWEKIKLDKDYNEKNWLAYFEITNAEHPELKYNVSVNVMEGTIIKFLPAGAYYIRELDDTWQILEMMASEKNDAGEFNYDPDSKVAYFTLK